ncbi:hypothetical protein [Janibacter melonis]|nr:hypothetical protein [Janibacter melonis]
MRIFVVELTEADGEEEPLRRAHRPAPGASAQHPWEVGFATHPAVRGRG